MKKAQVIVVGIDHFNTLGIIRSLGEIGLKPIAVILSESKNNAWTLRSKYPNKNLSCVIKPSMFSDALIQIGQAIGEKAYLIPSCDIAVKLLENGRNDLETYYNMPGVLNGAEKLTSFLDKTRSAEIALQAGFSVPSTMSFFADDPSQIKVAQQKFAGSYPLIVKENSSVSSKNHTKIIKTEAELLQTLKECGNDLIMLQQFIEKEEELGIQGVGFGDGASFIPGVIHKIRTSLDSMGSTTYAKLTTDIDPALKSKCESFIKALRYSGIFDIEVLRKGNEYYFVECNFRNGAYGYAYTLM